MVLKSLQTTWIAWSHLPCRLHLCCANYPSSPPPFTQMITLDNPSKILRPRVSNNSLLEESVKVIVFVDLRSARHLLHWNEMWLSAYRWDIRNFKERLEWLALSYSQQNSKSRDDQASWRICSATIILITSKNQNTSPEVWLDVALESRGRQSESF